jgi:hypothetical protein
VNRNKILRLRRWRNGLSPLRLEVLSDGGKFVVQELPIISIGTDFQVGEPGVVTLTFHADLFSMDDGEDV